MVRPTRVALALGSGGARGYAHIGVIEVLEERGYDIVSLAGSSMGAVIGGLHAAGRLDAYADWVRTLTQRDVLRLMDPTLRQPGAIRAEKIVGKVTELLGGAVIEELPIDFTAVATDLLAGREVWFQQGPVDTAIRASIALPSFVPPVMLNGRLLADGGLLNPVPVAATAAATADLTLGVALSESNPTPVAAAPVRESSATVASEDLLDRTQRSIAQRVDSELVRTLTSWFTGSRDNGRDETQAAVEARGDNGTFDPLPAGMRTLDVMQLSLETLQKVVARYRLAAYPPDLLITIPRNSCRVLDFHRAEEMIALGRKHTAEALDRATAED